MGDETRTRLLAALWPRIESALGARPAPPLHQQVESLSSEIGQWVVEELRRHYRDTDELVHRCLASALNDHMARVQAVVGEVVEHANQLLGMRAEAPRAVAPVSERASFYFRDWDYSGGHLVGHDWALRLPRRWAEPHARLRLRQLLERRIDQNLSAIRYGWATRLHDAVRRFTASSRDQLAAIIRMVSEALDRAEQLRASADAAARMATLDGELAEIEALRGGLTAGMQDGAALGRADRVGRERGR